MYQLICMGFDGEYQREHPEFNTIDGAWEYSNNIGSRWYFYPFHFVVNKNTIRDAGPGLEFLVGRRIKTVQRRFKYHSLKEDTQNMDADTFALTI